MQERQNKYWLDIVFPFIIVLCTAVVISIKFTYLMSSNDDEILREIASGIYTGNPDAHLIYIMYPLGFIWKCLYTWLPKVNWYDWFMVGMHYLCYFLLLFRISVQYKKKSTKIVSVIIAFVIMLIIDLPYLVMHQYTILAAWFGVIALFWTVTLKRKESRNKIFDFIVIAVMLLLCLWLRKQVFYMLCPMLVIVIGYKVAKNKTLWNKKYFTDLVIYSGALAVLVLLSFSIEKLAYNSLEWKDFNVYNEARTDVYDFYGTPPFDVYKDQYEQNGWNIADYEVINSNSIALMSEMNTEKIQLLADWSKEYAKWQEQFYSVYRKTLYAFCNEVLFHSVQPIGIILFGAYIGSLVYFFQKNKRKDGIAEIALLIFQCLFVSYFIWKGRFPERVSYSFYLCQLAVLFGMHFSEHEKTEEERGPDLGKFWKVVLGSLLVVVLMNVSIYRYKTVEEQNQSMIKEVQEWMILQQYCREHTESVYILKTNAVGGYGAKLFDNRNHYAVNTIYSGTWLLNSPLYKKRLDNLEIDNLEKALGREERVKFVQLSIETQDWLTDFFRNRGYSGEAGIEDEIVTGIENDFCVISMHR